MLVFPIKTRIITESDDILDVILEGLEKSGYEFSDHDILGIAETPLGTTEGRVVKLSDVKVSEEARRLAEQYELIPAKGENGGNIALVGQKHNKTVKAKCHCRAGRKPFLHCIEIGGIEFHFFFPVRSSAF